MSDKSKRLIHKLCFTRAGLLFQQVLIAQLIGLCIIVIPSLLLGGIFRKHACSGVFVVIATSVYFYAAYWNKPDSVKLLNRLRAFLGALVFFDLAIMLGLIGLSGGLANSHLTFVLALIPPILALVRGGGRTTISICVAIIIAVSLDIGATYFSKFPALLSPTFLFSVLFQNIRLFQPSDPSNLYYYPYVISLGIFLGTVLALIQSYFASGDTLPEDVLYRVIERQQNRLDDVREESYLLKVLAKSYHKASSIVSRTNHPDIHCSLVHPIDDLIFEAYILALSAYQFSDIKVPRKRRKAAKQMANMVFAIHWLDDLFDGLGYHAFFEVGQNTPSVDMMKINLKDIGRKFRPHGVKRIIKFITDKSSWPEGVNSGIMRVIIGGIIQRTADANLKDSAIRRCKYDIQQIVKDDKLNKMLENISPVFLWSISKTNMPLVLGIFTNQEQTQNLGSISLVLDALLMPLLVWHDFEEEVRREHVGISQIDKFNNMIEGIKQAVNEANEILEEKLELIYQSNIYEVMRLMVKGVFDEFSDRLPPNEECYKKYRDMIENFFNKSLQLKNNR